MHYPAESSIGNIGQYWNLIHILGFHSPQITTSKDKLEITISCIDPVSKSKIFIREFYHEEKVEDLKKRFSILYNSSTDLQVGVRWLINTLNVDLSNANIKVLAFRVGTGTSTGCGIIFKYGDLFFTVERYH